MIKDNKFQSDTRLSTKHSSVVIIPAKAKFKVKKLLICQHDHWYLDQHQLPSLFSQLDRTFCYSKGHGEKRCDSMKDFWRRGRSWNDGDEVGNVYRSITDKFGDLEQ